MCSCMTSRARISNPIRPQTMRINVVTATDFLGQAVLGYSQGLRIFRANMDPIPNVLSLWEVAHRWHDAIPSASDESSVTREIRDTLLALIEQVGSRSRWCGVTRTYLQSTWRAMWTVFRGVGSSRRVK